MLEIEQESLLLLYKEIMYVKNMSKSKIFVKNKNHCHHQEEEEEKGVESIDDVIRDEFEMMEDKDDDDDVDLLYLVRV